MVLHVRYIVFDTISFCLRFSMIFRAFFHSSYYCTQFYTTRNTLNSDVKITLRLRPLDKFKYLMLQNSRKTEFFCDRKT